MSAEKGTVQSNQTRLVSPSSRQSPQGRSRKLTVGLKAETTAGRSPLTVGFSAAVLEGGSPPFSFELIAYGSAIRGVYEEFKSETDSLVWTPSLEFLVPGTYSVYVYAKDRKSLSGVSPELTITVLPGYPHR